MGTYVVLLALLSMCSLCFSQECNPTLLENEDFPGTDMLHMFSPDAEHCQLLCTEHPSCQFFTFIRPDWTRDKRHFYCYLKSTATGVPNTRSSLLGVTSGFSLKSCTSKPETCLSKVYRDIDFPGADYKFLFTANHEDCQRACTNDPSCQFFTYVTDVFQPENIRYKCHLKFSWPIPRTPIVEAKAGVVSGFSHNVRMSQTFDTVCQGKLFPNTAIPGDHLLALPASSAEHCLTFCSAHPSCTFFTFQSEDFTCNLKNNPNEMVSKAKSGVTSGIPQRFCQLDNSWAKVALDGIDFRGSDMRYEVMDDAESCQKTCTADANCQFYTYVNESFLNPVYWHRCYHKRQITMPTLPKVTKLSNVISGFTRRNCVESAVTPQT